MSDNIYIVYKTTNLVNGKFYIGVHKVKGAGNGYYLGSGLALKGAIKKYGRDNFKRETLFSFDNSDDAYEKEFEVVNESLVFSEKCYNLCQGGLGALSGENHPLYGKSPSKETRKKMSQSQLGKKRSTESIKKRIETTKGIKRSKETRKKISDSKKGEGNPMYGKSHSKEAKMKISIAHKGENNHFYGKAHSEEAIKKIRESKQEYIYTINGNDYISASTASKAEGIDPSNIVRKCDNPNFPTYTRKRISETPIHSRKQTERTKTKIKKSKQKFLYIINNIEYISSSDASKEEGIYPSTLIRRCDNPNFPNYTREPIIKPKL